MLRGSMLIPTGSSPQGDRPVDNWRRRLRLLPGLMMNRMICQLVRSRLRWCSLIQLWITVRRGMGTSGSANGTGNFLRCIMSDRGRLLRFFFSVPGISLYLWKRGSDLNRLWKRGEVGARRSEEHTSELQSLMRISYAVFCLKKKNDK